MGSFSFKLHHTEYMYQHYVSWAKAEAGMRRPNVAPYESLDWVHHVPYVWSGVVSFHWNILGGVDGLMVPVCSFEFFLFPSAGWPALRR